MKKTYILLIILFTVNFAHAQWTLTTLTSSAQTSISYLASVDSNLFAEYTYNCGDENNPITCGTLYATTDFGSNWFVANAGLTLNGYYVNALATDQSNAMFIATNGGVFSSYSGGQNWDPKNTGITDNNVNAIAANGFDLYAGTQNNGVFKSIDNANNWTNINTGLPSTTINVLSTNIGFIYAGTNMGMYLSADSGATWNAINSGLLANSIIKAIASSANNIYVGTDQGKIYMSSNNGSNWNNISNGLTCTGINAIIINANKIFAATNGGGVFLSVNNGSSWMSINNGLTNSTYTNSLAICGNYIYAAAYGGVWKRNLAQLTGIDEYNYNTEINIYPNPASKYLTIETNANYKQSLEIVNMLGQSMHTYYIYSKATIDISTFPKGIYFIKLNTEKGIIIKKFVKE